MTRKIGLIVGSNRKESWNRKVAEVVQTLFPENYEVEFIRIDDLGFYNEDLDNGNPPAEWTRFRKEIEEKDGFVFFTPEYNRTFAPLAKNAIDIGSRPYGESKWPGKVAGVISATIGGTGAMLANHGLRQTFVFTDMIPVQQPEVYLANVADLFDGEGKMVAGTVEFLQGFVDRVVELVETVK